MKWQLRVIGMVATLLVWELLGRRLGVALLAPPSAVFPKLFAMIADGSLPRALGGSLRQMLVGYALACVIGFPLGIAMGRSRVVDLLLHPWLSMLIVTSVASMLPLFIMVFGTGFNFRLSIVFVSCIFYILLTAYQGARDLDKRWVEVGQAFAAPRLFAFRTILLPALVPYLFTGARIGLGMALRGMIIGEMFVIIGFGGLIHDTGLQISTETLLALLFGLMVVSLSANEALRWFGNRLAPWYQEQVLAR